jgi:hypothetical protein
MVLEKIGKVILFPVYIPYKLYKKATEGNIPPDLKEQLKGDTAQHIMQFGFTPEQSMKMSEEFWEKNKNKLKEALRL